MWQIELTNLLSEFVSPKRKNNRERGSVLVMIIISIVIIATIGTAMLTTSSITMYTQIGAVDTLKGFFLAEAGKYFALTKIKWEMDNDISPTVATTGSCFLYNTGNCASATPKTFTLPNSVGQFTLSLTVSPSGCNNSTTKCTYNLTSTGIPNGGTNRVLTFQLSE